MKTATLTTEPFSCPSCVAKIEKALGRTTGVEAARVMFNSNKVKITFDDAQVQADELASLVTDLGYRVTKTAVA